MQFRVAAGALMITVAVSCGACGRERVKPVPERRPPTVDVSSASSAAQPPSAPLGPAPSPTSSSALSKQDGGASPESFAAAMTGTIGCGKHKCRAGREVCVSSPNPASSSHCEPIRRWIDQRTPEPRGGFPPMAGITACDGSYNCPAGTVCCLHEIGNADVQAAVCHGSLDECRDKEELCREGAQGDCRTPGTKCDQYRCVAR